MPDPNLLTPDSPATATVTREKDGGVTVDVFVPTFSGGMTLQLAVERSNDGDWRIFIPWLDDMDEDKTYILQGNVAEVANGIAYVGAPDVPTIRTVPAAPMENTNPLWDDDTIQFARLLAEISATQDSLDIAALCESMNLEPADVDALFERADVAWKAAVADLDAQVDVVAAALGRKVAEALEAGGCGLLGETERVIIYRVLRDDRKAAA